eukprot:scaffold569399_cov16-Prasinocladus_malaysianus.AAC.1
MAETAKERCSQYKQQCVHFTVSVIWYWYESEFPNDYRTSSSCRPPESSTVPVRGESIRALLRGGRAGRPGPGRGHAAAPA